MSDNCFHTLLFAGTNLTKANIDRTMWFSARTALSIPAFQRRANGKCCYCYFIQLAHKGTLIGLLWLHILISWILYAVFIVSSMTIKICITLPMLFTWMPKCHVTLRDRIDVETVIIWFDFILKEHYSLVGGNTICPLVVAKGPLSVLLSTRITTSHLEVGENDLVSELPGGSKGVRSSNG